MSLNPTPPSGSGARRQSSDPGGPASSLSLPRWFSKFKKKSSRAPDQSDPDPLRRIRSMQTLQTRGEDPEPRSLWLDPPPTTKPDEPVYINLDEEREEKSSESVRDRPGQLHPGPRPSSSEILAARQRLKRPELKSTDLPNSLGPYLNFAGNRSPLKPSSSSSNYRSNSTASSDPFFPSLRPSFSSNFLDNLGDVRSFNSGAGDDEAFWPSFPSFSGPFEREQAQHLTPRDVHKGFSFEACQLTNAGIGVVGKVVHQKTTVVISFNWYSLSNNDAMVTSSA